MRVKNTGYRTSNGFVIGQIPYPCHPQKRVMVFEGASGEVSSACPVCGSFSIFNFDSMAATKAGMMRGATKRFK